ncbi:MAG: peptidase S10, partial [Candidatus Eremiobacteraeota bacterium]|nr:peptidase S10 [Candidatus Eremiobacteraeota bacterium]
MATKRFAPLCAAIALLGAAAPSESPAPMVPPSPAATDAVTEHTLTLAGKEYAYTARAGTIVLENDKNQPTCRMFFTAFTLDGGDAGSRPVTFFYNGGPGSSTIWLRMGSFAPVRVQIPDAATSLNAPFDLVPNQYSLLDRTDMVFVDAPDTGFSRIIGAGKPSEFFGVDQDMHAFSQFVSRYLTTYGRWNSPKFLFGESYGTPRTAVVVNDLQRQGIGINGVVLLSSILDF